MKLLLARFCVASLLLSISPEPACAQDLGTFRSMLSTQTRLITRRTSSPVLAKARIDISTRMVAVSRIAEINAGRSSKRLCWRYVKQALLEAGAVDFCPSTPYAKMAGKELVDNHGFARLKVRNPFDAPIGSVPVYGGQGAGHVEIRTVRGYVSDYKSRTPCGLPFLGAYAKKT